MRYIWVIVFLGLCGPAWSQAALPVIVSNPASNPAAAAIYGTGNATAVSIDGSLSVNTPPHPEFFDGFSTALDTTTNWTANNSTGTAATSGGNLVVSSSTTNAAWGGLTSKQSWGPSGLSPEVFGVAATFANSTIANTSRIFGIATIPGTPTTSVPVTDGYIWRLDGTGALFGEVWASGVAVSSTNLTTACKPADGTPNLYAINFRTNLVIFTCGVTTAAVIQAINPVNQTLPVSAFSIAGTAPGSSATLTLGGITLVTYAPASIKKTSQAPTINDASLVVTISPNSPAITTSGTVALSSQYPSGSVPLTATATGTTAATVATLAGTSGKTTFICGFTISADATTAVAGAATVVGTISGSLNYIQNVGAATAAGVLTQTFNPCIPASATNTPIVITSAAAGIAGNTSVNGWGYQL